MEELLSEYLEENNNAGIKINHYEEVGTIINVEYTAIYTQMPNPDYEWKQKEQVKLSDLLIWVYNKVKH